jgi:hypothetical protein
VDMMDNARARALAILSAVRDGSASGVYIDDNWPVEKSDLVLVSIHFWLWTLYDDNAGNSQMVRLSTEEECAVLGSCMSFLESQELFKPRDTNAFERLSRFFKYGLEWMDAELPWHESWPYPVGTTRKQPSKPGA